MKWFKLLGFSGLLTFCHFLQACTDPSSSNEQQILDDPSTPSPTIETITPAQAPSTGGIMVQIKGSGFTTDTKVSFNNASPTTINRISDTELQVMAPKMEGTLGDVDVTVGNPTKTGGIKSNTAKHLFSYFLSDMKLSSAISLPQIDVNALTFPIDMDLDGKFEIFTATLKDSATALELYAFDQTGKKLLASSVDAISGTVTAIFAADLNGDQKPELVVGTKAGEILVYLNDGAGKFTKLSPFGAMFPIKFFASGDFNLDGYQDIAVLAGNYAGTLISDGRGRFKLSPFGFAGSDLTSMTVLDANKDGYLDLIVVTNKKAYMLRSNKDKETTFQIPTIFDLLDNVKTFSAQDFNADKELDIVSLTEANGKVFLNLLISEGRKWLVKELIELTLGEDTVFLRDLNGDQIIDIVATGDTGTVSILLGKGDDKYDPPISIEGTPGSRVLGMSDVNADKKLDFFMISKENLQPGYSLLLNTSL